ncbi:MAG: hypothetical protein AAFX85_05790, partial [Pseudomonadota bacterium]
MVRTQSRRSDRLRTALFIALGAGAFAALVVALLVLPRLLGPQTPTDAAAAPVAQAQCDLASESQDGCGDRQTFLDALKVFQRDIEPALADINLPAWDAAAQERIDELSDQATRHFDQGRYDAALETLTQAVGLSEDRIARSADLFVESVESARAAFADDAFAPANAAIRQALLIDGEDSGAKGLA